MVLIGVLLPTISMRYDLMAMVVLADGEQVASRYNAASSFAYRSVADALHCWRAGGRMLPATRLVRTLTEKSN